MKANGTIKYTNMFQMPGEVVTLSALSISHKTVNELVFINPGNHCH